MVVELISTPLISDANLVSYYQFNTGALTTDYKANYTLTNNGTVAETASGKFGYAADFGVSNSSKYFSSASNMGIDGGAISVSMWVKIQAEPGEGVRYTLFDQRSAGTDTQYLIYYTRSGGVLQLVVRRGKPGVADVNITTNATLGTTDWHHIVLTYDTTNLISYLDNVASSPSATSGSGTTPQTDKVTIGASTTPDSYSSVFIDDLAVFSKGLSTNEVGQIFDYVAPISGSPIFFGNTAIA